MMKKIFAIVLILLSASSLGAISQPSSLTAREMLAICTDQTQEESLICNAYMKGFLDGMINGSSLVSWNVQNNQTVSYATVKDSFIKLLHTYPMLGGNDVGSVASAALQEAGLVVIKQRISPFNNTNMRH